MLKSTRRHTKYWTDRKIDWDKAYTATANHPHRDVLMHLLSKLKFESLLELGCASGPNLLRINKLWPHVEIGGTDISKDAVATAQKNMPGKMFKVAPAHKVFMSDNSTDIVLTDMCLIYYGPTKIKKALREAKRLARKHIVLFEFHSDKLYNRLALQWDTGYYAYNYVNLLEGLGCYDVQAIKMPREVWGEPQQSFGHYIIASV